MADLDLVVVDESFLEFADAESEPSVVEDAVMRPNVIVLRSLGKNFGLHGIRFGYLVANPALAGKVRSMLPKWNLNSFAESVVFMLRDHGAEYRESLHMVRRDRLDMARELAALPGLTVYPSQGNFLFVRLPVGAEGTMVRDRLLTEHRILVRECGNKIGSSSRFLRLVVRPQADVRRLVSGLEQVLYGSRRGAAVPEPAAGTGYSSGTAAVDRLVGATNGAGTPGLAAQAADRPGSAPQPGAVPAPPPVPVLPPAPPVRPAAAVVFPDQEQPGVAPGRPFQQPFAATAQAEPAGMPQPGAWPPAAPGAMPAQAPPAPMPAPAGPAGLRPAAAAAGGGPGSANAASLGAQGGLTAAQVRGRTEPEPPPPPRSADGWGAVGAMLYNQAG